MPSVYPRDKSIMSTDTSRHTHFDSISTKKCMKNETELKFHYTPPAIKNSICKFFNYIRRRRNEIQCKRKY